MAAVCLFSRTRFRHGLSVMKKRTHKLLGGATLLMVLAGGSVAGPTSRVDELGRLDRLAMGSGWARVNTDVRVYLKGWSRHVSLFSAPDVQSATNGETRVWTGTLAPNQGQGPAVQAVQTVREQAGKIVFEVKATGAKATSKGCSSS
jgi:hypothetical protein